MVSRTLMLRSCVALAICICCLFPQMAACRDEPETSGIILAVSGSVSLRSASGSRCAVDGMVVQPGDTLVVVLGGRCNGFSPDGGQFDLTGPAELVLEEVEPGGMINEASSWLRRLVSRWIGEERRQVLTTRAVSDWEVTAEAPGPVLPAQGGAVRPTEARLCWSTFPGIERYRVTLAREQEEETARTVIGHTLMLEDLAPGPEYIWKVQPALKDWTGVSQWHSFRVLAPEEEEALDRALEGKSDLQAGFILLSTGLHEEALSRFDRAQASEHHARSAHFWKARVLAELGLYEQAYRNLTKARAEDGQ